ncbi:hypothetical protein PN462_09010 [Spirulina sp. CS-785/01]|uniref:hypothetical protein n=1 Tax=Spirulina sp. CS-785/01 TaxID=3021716 RepID=UPI00232E7B64|nr:hypothetical protein [Spirulina sp. CS-785/01]MDB9313237.1 hypothetical protein [Spirulina sp. CS-785/01]
MNFERDHKLCFDKLTWAMGQLGVAVGEKELSKIADLIVQTMTGPWRYFHTPDHIFEVGGSANAIEVLAALFHDLVYVQVDQSVNFNLTYYISPFIRDIQDHLYIRDQEDLPDDPMFDLVIGVFGFKPGQQLSPFAGQNEFLSALVCARVLVSFLHPSLILQIVTCIEATIPFRPAVEGKTAADRLYENIQTVNQDFQLGLSEGELIESVQRAVRMANRDVGSFAHPSSARFLDNTWSLLPETNHNLKNPSSYTVIEYRVALQKMEGFMNFLRPELVFQQFKGEPPNQRYHSLLERAGRNIAIARIYLGSKLFTMAVLEALSRRFGRNIPLSTIMGEFNPHGLPIEKLEDFLPDVPLKVSMEDPLEQEILGLLEKGRFSSSSYDIKNSPLTTLIVKIMGFQEISDLLDQAKAFFKDEISNEEFLALCNPEVVRIITESLSKLFDSRKAALLQMAKVAS